MEALDTLKDRLPDVDVSAEESAGAVLFGLGLVLGAMRVLRNDRGWFGWVMPGGLIFAGLSMLIDGTWDRRSRRIIEAEESVREELAGLDPFARAQVLKDIAEEEAEPIIEMFSSDE